MICIRYYFEPIHNGLPVGEVVGLVVYDMYKILFCQHVKDHPLRCKYTMFFCNHQNFSFFSHSMGIVSRNFMGREP